MAYYTYGFMAPTLTVPPPDGGQKVILVQDLVSVGVESLKVSVSPEKPPEVVISQDNKVVNVSLEDTPTLD